MFTFQKATVARTRARARIALIGPSGSGKTFTALRLANGFGGKIAVIDTEHGSASKYADVFSFDVLELSEFAPSTYVRAIGAAERAGYDVIVIDSLTHAWTGKGGALDMVTQLQRRYRGNSFAAWKEVTPEHNALLESMISSKSHIITTMRSKTEYVLQSDHRGRQVPVKVGLEPIQRDGIEYEFDITAWLDQEHNLRITKSRCPALDNATVAEPGEEVAHMIQSWLGQGNALESTRFRAV